METKAQYVIVGAVAILSTAFIIAFILYLGGSQIDRQYDQYDVIFEGGVSGLQRGADVKYNGISVGSVQGVRLDPSDPNTVLARINVDPLTPIKTDSYAVLEPQGLTGLSYLLINAGTEGEPLLKSVSSARIPRIIAQPGTLEALLVGGEEIVQSSNEALIRLNRILSQTNIENVTLILDDAQTLVARLAEISENFETNGEVMRQLKSTLESFERTSLQIEQTAKDVSALTVTTESFLNTEANQAMIDVSKSANEFYDASVDGAMFIEELDVLMKKVESEMIPQIAIALNDISDLVDSIDRMSRNIERSPSNFVAGEAVKKVEIEKN